jgi:arylsulfatase A-like enzyme
MGPRLVAAAVGLLAVVGCLSGLASAPGAGADARDAVRVEKGRPNILYIFADDQSYRSIGAYRHAGWNWVRTPSIDRLAASGVRFEYAYCGSWCVPSRVTMLTGLQPHAVNGLAPSRRELDPARVRFWPEEFRRGGYRTAFIGKWHIKGYGEQALWSRDWDHWVAWDHTREGNGGYYGEKSRDGTQQLEVDGRIQDARGYPTDNYTGHAIEFIRRDHDRPWFLWLCYGASHAPYIPAERHRDAYRDVPVPIPSGVFGPRERGARVMRDFSMFTRPSQPGGVPVYATNYGTAPLDEWVRRQNRTVLAIDEGVGRILDELEATGQRENTIVVYGSDNGFPWGEQGFANKNGPYEACQRTPLIVSWPGKYLRGATFAAPVAQADLVPTFFTAAGIALPWTMHGEDLSPILADTSKRRERPVMIEYFDEAFGQEAENLDRQGAEPAKPWDPPAWWISLRSGPHHYIRWITADEREELYDVERDPGELSNLAGDAANRATLLALRSAVEEELRRTGSRLAERLPKPLEYQ